MPSNAPELERHGKGPQVEGMRPAADVGQLAFDARIVLIHRRRQALMVLNETASFVWQALRARTPVDEVVAQLAEGSGAPRALVESDVEAILATWQDAGLLGEDQGSPAAETVTAPVPRRRRVRARTYALCGRPVRFEFAHRSLEEAVHSLLAPAEVEDATSEDRISMYASGESYVVAVNDRRPESRADIEGALGQAIIDLLDLSYPRARWLAIVHAGAVAGAGGALLLPGISGSGKSTLTAALVHAGLQYLSDDIAPLDGDTGHVLPVPFALSVKEGSWSVLQRAYPELMDRPVHRNDARRWRYLDLASARAPLTGFPPAAIAFPRYQPGAQTTLAQLAPLDALEGLVQARCWISLEPSDVAAVLDLLARVPCFRLSYSSLDDAVRACLELVRRAPG